MRPTLTIMFMAMLIYACGPMRNIQKVQSRLPLLGSIGKHESGLFKKIFQKVGEPYLTSPIAVALESVTFNKSMKSRYSKYREYLGKQPSAVLTDTTQTRSPRYYQLKISNVVDLVEELNQDKNKGLKKYLEEDTDLSIISHISFMANIEVVKKMEETRQLYLKTDNDGVLNLYLGDWNRGEPIRISTLEIFDFKTAKFCWQKDKRGRFNIAHILTDGSTCPGTTVTNPKKLNKIPDYLKI